MSASLRKLALVFAGAGLVVSLLAAYTHYRMLADVGYVSFCDVSATVSCTQVYSSRFGTFAGIPVAVFGAIWFALATLLAIAGFVARAEVRENVPGYLFAGSTLALAGVLYLGYASFVRSRTRVCALRDHVCCGDRTLSRVWCGDLVSHDLFATSCRS